MIANLSEEAADPPIALTLVDREGLHDWLDGQDKQVRRWLSAVGFKASIGEIALVPDDSGKLERVVAGRDPESIRWTFGGLGASLPVGTYGVDTDLPTENANAAALGWALAGYSFDRYSAKKDGKPKLVWPAQADRALVERIVEGTFLVRDLVNTPTSDMGPSALESAARSLAERHKATTDVTTGDALLDDGFRTIHAVGRAAADPPRLIDIRWGRRDAPMICLVGKGVCFDSGGLNLKSAGGMKLMKKDMGGAAHALALAGMIMDAGLKVQLRVLIPAVENSVDGAAMRPLDVIKSKSGRTIEVGHTDAEGRLILADALTEAVAGAPELLIDFATLTGAARIALGTEVAALFSNDDALADEILAAGDAVEDAVWRLPLWKPYEEFNKSDVADISNEPKVGQGGAISAALFLQSFVGDGVPWAHFDIMAWNQRDRPGRPKGGEAMGLCATYAIIATRYGN